MVQIRFKLSNSYVFTDVDPKLYNYIADVNLQFLIHTVKLF